MVVHEGITCDWCLSENIAGRRYNCSECSNFDLCETCMDQPQGVHSSYSGRFTHPALGPEEIEVFITLRTNARGYWTAGGQNQEIMASVVPGVHFKVEDGETILEGKENSAGTVAGGVSQRGESGGSFALHRVAPAVHDPSHTFKTITRHLSQEEELISQCEISAQDSGMSSQAHKQALFMLADFYRLTCNSLKAIQKYEEAIKGWPRSVSKSVSRLYVVCLNNCSMTYLSIGNDTAAELHAENAVHFTKEYFHEDGELLGACLNTLAEVRRRQRRFPESHNLLEEALAAERKAYGKVSKPCMLTLNNLANLEECCGELRAAELHYRQSIEMQEAVDPSYMTALVNFSDLLYQQGRFSEACSLSQKAIAILQSTPGSEQDPSISLRSLQLGECFLQLGNLKDAQKALQRARELAPSLPAPRQSLVMLGQFSTFLRPGFRETFF